MAKSKEHIKNKKLKTHTLKAVQLAKISCQTEKEFCTQLKKQAIDVLFRRNDDGRIYGATFIDHTTRTVLNGSRIGKEFSANVFNNLYGDDKGILNENTVAEESTKHQEDSYSSDSSLIAGIFSVFNPEPVNHHNEQVFWTRLRKRKKRRYGRQL